MIFNYKVKHNGITYPAGANVPIEGERVAAVVETPKVDIPKTEDVPKATPKRRTKKK